DNHATALPNKDTIVVFNDRANFDSVVDKSFEVFDLRIESDYLNGAAARNLTLGVGVTLTAGHSAALAGGKIVGGTIQIGRQPGNQPAPATLDLNGGVIAEGTGSLVIAANSTATMGGTTNLSRKVD